MKFSQMPYTRPGLDETKSALESLIAAFERADSAESARAAYMAADAFNDHLTTLGTLAYIRHSLDTTDVFYDAEQTYFDEIQPILEEPMQRLSLALLKSPYRADLEREFGSVMFKNIEIRLKTFDPAIIADLQEENSLTTEYDKLLASAQIPFDGKTLTLAQITPYLQDPSAVVRRAALDARSAWLSARTDKLDGIFARLTELRTQIAKKLGYETYTQLGYWRMTRNCYDKEMVDRFRDGVRRYIVPIATRLKAEQAERINAPGINAPGINAEHTGAKTITMYDDAFEYPDGNAKPKGTPEQIFEHGKTMYNELSKETGEFIDFMLENDLFDVLTRPGKSGGGYCTDIPDYKAAFIFANFNGTSGDIDVLTHEAGHAFAAYMCRDKAPSPLRDYTYETAEVHSMSMEFFTWPWMEGFFKEDTAKYRYSHLASALTFLPYGTMVDDFQHQVYENPGMTPDERNKLWRELEGIYRPWLDLDNTPFFEEGRRWQYQAHIYASPFYYIDYCLAQTVALRFWAEAQDDHAAAWERYMKFIGLCGRHTFTEILTGCGLPTPFDPEMLKTVAEAAARWLDERK